MSDPQNRMRRNASRHFDSASTRSRTQGRRTTGRRRAAVARCVPGGAFAEVRDGKLHLVSIVADPDGSKLLRDSRAGTDPERLGNEAGAAPVKLRFTGTAVETVEAAVPVRTLERGEMLKANNSTA